jgi:hypothetical protein
LNLLVEHESEATGILINVEELFGTGVTALPRGKLHFTRKLPEVSAKLRTKVVDAEIFYAGRILVRPHERVVVG